MIIVINTGFKDSRNQSSSSVFFMEVMKRLTALHPEHRFILLYEKGTKETILSGENIMPVFIKHAGRHPLLWKYWYDIKLPALLKKHKADLFVSFNGICSLRTKLPQCLLIGDLSYLYYPGQYKKSHLKFYKKNTPFFLLKAEQVITLSDFAKQEIGSKYKVPVSKVSVVSIGVNKSYKPADLATKEATRNKYTEGKEYFTCQAGDNEANAVIGLLKSFSLFKKKQKTNMKLVVAGEIVTHKSFIKSLSSYKYKTDVVLADMDDADELASITAAAYVSVYPCPGDEFNFPIAEAIRCDVPVITIDEAQKKEVAKEAALYAESNNNADMADKMMLLYKDEKLRKELIEKGRLIAMKFNWEKATADIWDSIQKALE